VQLQVLYTLAIVQLLTPTCTPLPFIPLYLSLMHMPSFFSDTVRQGVVFYYYWKSDSIVYSIVIAAPDFKNENTCLHGVNCDCC